MKNTGRVIMLIGLAIAFINYVSFIGRTETIMQQIFQVAETIMIIIGFYVLGKGISFTKNDKMFPLAVVENESVDEKNVSPKTEKKVSINLSDLKNAKNVTFKHINGDIVTTSYDQFLKIFNKNGSSNYVILDYSE
jgi:predicted nucleic acid-binding OB-fold protein